MKCPKFLKKAAESRIKYKASLGRRILMVPVVFAAIVAAGPARVSLAQSSADQWRFGVTPYFWFINLAGDLRYSPIAGGSPHVEISNKDLLQKLDLGFMLSGEARKGRWSVFTDVIYFDLSSQESRVKAVDFNLGGPVNPTSTALDAGTSSSLKAWVWTLAGSVGVVDGPAVTLEALGGFRYLAADASTDWRLTATVTGPGAGQVFQRTGSISQSEDVWDAIAGVRGKVRLRGSRWAIPYYADIGAGNSELTWQGMAGLSYGFDWGEAIINYRYLYYDMKQGGLFEDLRFEGPGIGITFRF
ncbi:MAG: hypothetical protein ABIL58_05925 [Pseudomonadota bacterium]